MCVDPQGDPRRAGPCLDCELPLCGRCAHFLLGICLPCRGKPVPVDGTRPTSAKQIEELGFTLPKGWRPAPLRSPPENAVPLPRPECSIHHYMI